MIRSTHRKSRNLLILVTVVILMRPDAGLGQERSFGAGAPANPELLLPGLVSTDLGERDAAFHPNGEEFYFTLWTGRFGVIMQTRLEDGAWSGPETTSFSGHFNDLEPFVTSDGRQLYFASNRPVDPGGDPGDFNIWAVDRDGGRWSDPYLVNVSTEVNEFYPSVDRNGVLYWTASYEDSHGGEDIYYATPTDTGFSAAVNVGEGVNTERDEFNALIAPDGSWLAFGSFGREDGLGGGDLYLSFKQNDGNFGPAVNMGPKINSNALDFCPALTPDGKAFLFSSRRTVPADPSEEKRTYDRIAELLRAPGNGRSDLYWIDAGFIDELRVQVAE